MAPAQRVDPIVGFRFGVEIKGVVQGWFTECSGLSIEREVYPHQEGGTNDYEYKLPGRVKYSNITLKRGIADSELWDWFQKGLYDGKVERRDVSIILYSGDRKKAKRWNLTNTYPIKWTGPDFKTEGNQVAIEALEIVHHGLEMTDWTNV
jgi:phage tail-like protein